MLFRSPCIIRKTNASAKNSVIQSPTQLTFRISIFLLALIPAPFSIFIRILHHFIFTCCIVCSSKKDIQTVTQIIIRNYSEPHSQNRIFDASILLMWLPRHIKLLFCLNASIHRKQFCMALNSYHNTMIFCQIQYSHLKTIAPEGFRKIPR